MKTTLLFLFLTMAAVGIAPRASAAPTALEAASRSPLTNQAGSGGSFLPGMTPDGRFFVFVSRAPDLVDPALSRLGLNVFLRDRDAETNALVSASLAGDGGDDDSTDPVVSTNGQWVAFVSTASNLVPDDTNGVVDIFVRDLASGVTRLVSVSTNGGVADGASGAPLLSQDGRWIVFESKATNLVTGDLNGTMDVFARDLWSNVTVAVSFSTNGLTTANGRSELAAITPDGQFIAFVSTATDLTGRDTNAFADVFVRDLEGGTTRLASPDIATQLGAGPDGYRCVGPVLSADGGVVAFKAMRPGGTNPVAVVRYEVGTGSTLVLSSNSVSGSPPQLSADGRCVVAEDGANVWLWDVVTGTNTVVSVSTNGTASTNGFSHSPVMTPDARRVAFFSDSAELTLEANNGIDQLYVRDLAKTNVWLISRNRQGLASEFRSIEITPPVLSLDGESVAFESLDGDLVADDWNVARDVFVLDVLADAIELVSRRASVPPAQTGAGFSRVTPHSLSADGSRVLFRSHDGNMAPLDTNLYDDVFVADLPSGRIWSITAGHTVPPAIRNNQSHAVLSETGRYVAFGILDWDGTAKPFAGRYDLLIDVVQAVDTTVYLYGDYRLSAESPLAITPDGNRIAFPKTSGSAAQIFVFDIGAGTSNLVSAPDLSTSSYANQNCYNPLMNPDGRWVLFFSTANNLVSGLNSAYMKLFARETTSNRTRLVSHAGPDMSPLDENIEWAVISTNSHYVAFSTQSAVAGRGPVVFRHDLTTNRPNDEVCTNCLNPSISGDGRFISYETKFPAPAINQVFVKDLESGDEELVSVNLASNGGGNGPSSSALVSSDARFVVFVSKASDLVVNDTNGFSDIFVRDRSLGTTALLSVNRLGTGSGNGTSTGPVLSADGRTVAFHSMADDLVDADYNNRRDVFVVRLGGGDADGDRMADDWEVAFFSTLGGDGSGDFDGDGMGDRDEFLAGTDPTNRGSVLRVLTITSLSGGNTMLVWSAVPGRRYRVQYKDSVNDSDWAEFPAMVTAETQTAAFTDTNAPAGGTRFYRVLIAE